LIKGRGFTYEKFNFPCGETHIKIKEIHDEVVGVSWYYERDAEIYELLLLCDTLRLHRLRLSDLYIPYVPASRQDRVNEKGECFSLRTVCRIINLCGAEKVTIVDPHSDVTPALLDNCVVRTQADIFGWQLPKKPYNLICPDAGAAKKIQKLAAISPCASIIQCRKCRTSDGKVYVDVPEHYEIDIADYDSYVVDDICDGGATFIKIGEQLRRYQEDSEMKMKNVLMVTHGFFTKGMAVLYPYYDEIYTMKGRVYAAPTVETEA